MSEPENNEPSQNPDDCPQEGKNPSRLPSWWQTALASIFGISIGLFLSQAGNEIGQHQIDIDQESIVALGQTESSEKRRNSLFRMPELSFGPKLAKRKNILLLGVDSNGRNTKRFEHTRSDTIMIASLDPVDGRVGLLSIPRDSRVRINGAKRTQFDKINSAHAWGGPELTARTISEDFGIPIDNYIVVDTHGLKSIFELIGPVEIEVEKRMRYTDRASGLYIDLEPGKQTLSPDQVEEYLRFRQDAKGDIGRIERQQWFLRQALAKLKEPAFFMKLPELLKFTNEYVVTDLSISELAELARFGKELRAHHVMTSMLPGEARMINGGSYWLPEPEACAIVVNRLTGAKPTSAEIALATNGDGDSRSKEKYSENEFRFVNLDCDDGLENGIYLAQLKSSFTRNSFKSAYLDSYDEIDDEFKDSIEKTETSELASFSSGDRLGLKAARKLEQPLASDFSSSERSLSVIIRYPKGKEEAARNFQTALEEEGYRVKARVRVNPSECRHEAIMLTSFRADRDAYRELRARIPELDTWPMILNPSAGARHDLALQLSGDTETIIPATTVRADFDCGISDIIGGEVKAGGPRKLLKLPSGDAPGKISATRPHS